MNIELFINICYIYSIKRLYIIPHRYSKILYIFLLSPTIISNGFLNTGFVSKKYWNFLRNLCYPNSKSITYDGDCSIYHTHYNCNTSLIKDYKITLNRIISLYFKYYSIHGLCSIILQKSPSFKKVFINELYNFIQSTSFLFLQNISQRLMMCHFKQLSSISLYGITSLSSLCIYLENNNRVSQINTMMISNLIIEIMNKHSKRFKSYLAILLLMLTFSKNKYIHTSSFILSIINGISDYTPNKKINILMEDTPILNLPWHPFL